ncbi:DUF4333 domain-containing protein [Pseudonocardia sp.]|uniref:DUF4333 domain-containing protein n=1 Tax=Pseudonocardia sp. TaxID=60912 RepID=UPI00261FC46A|nr:DUF4333 domain-containing protein [Pseudonocardia sp.]
MLAIVGVLALGGCGGETPGAGGVDVTEHLDAQLGSVGIVADPGSLACDDVDLGVGASVGCTFTAGGQPVGLTAEVTSVEGSGVGFDVSTQARPVPAEVLGTTVATRAGQQLGAAIDSAECAGELAPTVGESTSCTLTSGAETRDVTVTVTGVDGGRLDYTLDAA